MLKKIIPPLAILCLIFTFLVILAGGVVRTTGSGMGCPDWPKCFGQYVPPTTISELPSDYKTLFAVNGKEIATFSAFKTWVEYINRLLGALLGVLFFVLFLCSLSYLKERKEIPILAFLVLFATGFQGWLGSLVVASDLNAVKITIHMLVAIFILVLCVAILFALRPSTIVVYNPSHKKTMVRFLVLAIGTTLVQVTIGTQVREIVDWVSKSYQEGFRELWMGLVEEEVLFKIHRTFSWAVLIINGVILRDFLMDKKYYWGLFLVVMIGLEIAVGIGMAHFNIPAYLQPVHLLLATGIVAFQSWILLSILTPRCLTK